MSGQLVSVPDMAHLIFFAWIYSDSVVLIVPWHITLLTCKTVSVFTHLGTHLPEFDQNYRSNSTKPTPLSNVKDHFKRIKFYGFLKRNISILGIC